MSKDLNKHPSYYSRHQMDDPALSGAAAAGALSDDHSTPSNFPTKPTKASADLAELYHQENLFLALYRRINKMIHGGE